MDRTPRLAARRLDAQRGQILVIAALAMVALIGGVSLILEGGNAYAHQRMAQNAADSVANAGAIVLAQKLGGATKADADVLAATAAMAAANDLDTYAAFYTNVIGQLLTPAGIVTPDISFAARVGPADADTSIPPGTQGVQVGGSRTFGTTFARVIGINQFTASADATAVAGALTGGQILPMVFPVSLAECDGSGSTVVIDQPWVLSNPGTPHPNGQEYIVPLCKTGGGSFMTVDLDPDKTCAEEVIHPSSIQFADFPFEVNAIPGNACATQLKNAINTLHGTVVFIPICDGGCVTEGGKSEYHIIRIVGFFLDYMADNKQECAYATSPNYPDSSLVNIVGGNGSSSCLAGWFVRYITSGPVGSGEIHNGEAIGVQLIK